MRAALGINACVRQPQPLHGSPVHQVFLHNFRSIFGLHMPIPDCLGIHHDSGAVLALIQATGLVDAHRAPQPRGLGQLLELRMQFAFTVRSARGARRAFRTGIMADENVAFEQGQSMLLLS
jgi:hypothetical protein